MTSGGAELRRAWDILLDSRKTWKWGEGETEWREGRIICEDGRGLVHQKARSVLVSLLVTTSTNDTICMDAHFKLALSTYQKATLISTPAALFS